MYIIIIIIQAISQSCMQAVCGEGGIGLGEGEGARLDQYPMGDGAQLLAIYLP